MAKNTKKRKLKQTGGAKQQSKKQKLDRMSSESSKNDESLNSSGGSKKHLSWSKDLVSYQTKEPGKKLNKAKASVLHATELLTSTPTKSALAPKHRKSSEAYEMMSASANKPSKNNNKVLIAEKSSPMDLSEAGPLPVKLPKNVSKSKFAQKKSTPGADGDKSKKGKKKAQKEESLSSDDDLSDFELSEDHTDDELYFNDVMGSMSMTSGSDQSSIPDELMFATSESDQSGDEEPAVDEVAKQVINEVVSEKNSKKKAKKKKGKPAQATLVKSDESPAQKVEPAVIEQPKELNVEVVKPAAEKKAKKKKAKKPKAALVKGDASKESSVSVTQVPSVEPPKELNVVADAVKPAEGKKKKKRKNKKAKASAAGETSGKGDGPKALLTKGVDVEKPKKLAKSESTDKPVDQSSKSLLTSAKDLKIQTGVVSNEEMRAKPKRKRQNNKQNKKRLVAGSK